MRPDLIDARDVGALALAAAAGSVASFALVFGCLAAAAPLELRDVRTDAIASVFAWGAAFVTFLLLAALASAAAFTLGLGWRALSNRKGWRAWWRHALVGVALGAPIGGGISVAGAEAAKNLPFHVEPWMEPSVAVAIGAITGLVMATTAWLVRRPDLSSPTASRDPAWERLTRR